MAFDKTVRILDYWMAIILVNESLVGYSGVFSPSGYSVTDGNLEEVSSLVGKLTTVERQVIELVFQGYHNKSIACELKVAVRTVESRRSRAMVKLQVNSLAQLIQFWTKVQSLRVL
jgi:DNA-binding NarL/FixJ family response regulator